MMQEEYKVSQCPHCNKKHEVMVLDQPVELNVRGDVLVFDQRTLLCDKTYLDFMTPDEATRNLQRAKCAWETKEQPLRVLRSFDSFGLVEVKNEQTGACFLLEQAVWRYRGEEVAVCC